MTNCWIVGRIAKIATNGHEYISPPFLVFQTEAHAVEARDMIASVSGERIGIEPGSLYDMPTSALQERQP